MKCLNVIVFYNNRNEVFDYIKETMSNSNGYVDFALVVNSDISSEHEAMIRDLINIGINNVRVFDFGKNVGYLNSLLEVILLVDINDYDYFVLSNTDIRYQTESFYKDLSEKQYDKRIGCIAPSVYATKSGSYSNPHYLNRVSFNKLKRLRFIYKHPNIGRFYSLLAFLKANKVKGEKKDSCYVYSPHGCFMIFTKSFISEVIGYKYGVKLYSEESCVGELLILYEYKCYYDCSLEVIHQESTVTGKIDYKMKYKLWYESIAYIIDTFYK